MLLHTYILCAFCKLVIVNNNMNLLQDGVYVKGMHLQGAGWDKKNACLIEAEPMQLVCSIPTIHFKPVEARRRSQKGKFQSRVYIGQFYRFISVIWFCFLFFYNTPF